MTPELGWVYAGVLALLVVASLTGGLLDGWVTAPQGREVVANFNARVRAWWVMCAVLALALWESPTGAVVLFGLVSFLALREFITLTPTRRADHVALFCAFFVVLPLQYALVGIRWYGLFAILIPVYAFLILPIFSAVAGDPTRFLERTAKVQWGLMICVYCVSHIPGLLMLDIPGYAGRNPQLLVFLVLVAQLSDVLQYIFGKLWGRRRIAPVISPNKTWEGFLGGVGAATLMGAGLWWLTPFQPWEAAGMALLITLLGFAGGLCLSAIKRDLGVKDFGALLSGHGGILDRIDSLCFAAPLFFHITRYFFTG